MTASHLHEGRRLALKARDSESCPAHAFEPSRTRARSRMSEWKIVIPFPGGTEKEAYHGQGIHGILRLHDQPDATELPADGSCAGRPLALLTHGLLSHKNAIFFRPATKILGMDSFRWDIRFVRLRCLR